MAASIAALASPWIGASGASPSRPAASAAASAKTLRYAFRVAETNFDPAQITDLYSRTIASNIFDAPLAYAYLARPVRLEPNTAAGMPEASDDWKTFVVRIRPGIFFADDPAFKGMPRELVAADYVYSIKRHYDPRWKSGQLYLLESAKLLGLSELRKAALASRSPFDYDRPVEGLRALGRYAFEVRLAEPSPRFPNLLADAGTFGALAREVVEAYGDAVGEHPVGTGPFRLADWRRSALIRLERNPGYREERYDEDPPANDPVAQRFAAALKGRRLPMVDAVEISIVEENQPRWLSFLNGDSDLVWELPNDFADIATPNDRLAPNLAKMGLQMTRYDHVDVYLSYFAMEHPLVGGYAPEKVALRRAVSLSIDVAAEIRNVRHGQAVAAQGVIAPGAYGFDPALKTEMGEYSRAKARALLDLYGYLDRDGDGWREQPDGRPLVLEYGTQPDQQSRQLAEQIEKSLRAVGVRVVFPTAKWPENLKASRAGRLMMWGHGWSANDPDGDTFLALAYGPNKGQANHSRFDLPAYNALYERQHLLPNGPERLAAMAEANRLLVAYMPFKVHIHRVWTDMAQPWVVGFRSNTFVREFWKYVDIDTARLEAKR